MNRDEVVLEIYTAIAHANEMRSTDDQIAAAEETGLYGPGGSLDSLGLVSLVLDVEASVNARMGTNLVLADERAMAVGRNPFRDVRSLADYVMSRLAELELCDPEPLSS
jgi:acyl carrier protein